MQFKEFGEQAEIVYRLEVEVNGVNTGYISALSEHSLLEQLHKIDDSIKKQLLEQYEDLAEPTDMPGFEGTYNQLMEL